MTVYECFRSGRRRIDVELLHQGGPHRVANLIGPVGSARSAVLGTLPVDAVRVDLAVDDVDDVLDAAFDDPRGLVVVDNADSPAALAAVGAALHRRKQARAVVASRQPLAGWPGTPASLVPEIAVVPVVAWAGGTAIEDRAALIAPDTASRLGAGPPALPNSEPKLREVFDKLARHGRILVVVDQPATIGALPVTVARACGHEVAYLPGLAMRRIAELEVLVGYDDDLATEATRLSNRIRGLLTSIHPALERVLGPKVSHPAVLEILSRFGGPAGSRKASRRKLDSIAIQYAPRMGAKLVANILAA